MGYLMAPLLEVTGLSAHFIMPKQAVRAVDDVSFSIQSAEIIGLAGESGCGKSTVTQCILRLLPWPGKIVAGKINFKGEDLLAKTPEEMRQIRGKQISIVVQDALAALNPVITAGEQVTDVYQAHTLVSTKDAWERAVEMFRRVGIPNAKTMVNRFPHEFSGGMQQRTVIAAALVAGPDLIIADEPTTALDVTIQLQILALLRSARDDLGSGVLYISHDLAAVAQICSRVLIMYAGEIVEDAPTSQLFTRPLHPYTQGLIGSIPPLGGETAKYLQAIPGMPPDPSVPLTGCRFADRCRAVMPRCRAEHPQLLPVEGAHHVRCYLYEGKP
jgi:peptide/nickel transport system ATP-binding protein